MHTQAPALDAEPSPSAPPLTSSPTTTTTLNTLNNTLTTSPLDQNHAVDSGTLNDTTLNDTTLTTTKQDAEGDFTFYMDNSPQHTGLAKNKCQNSELAGDDDDEDEDEEPLRSTTVKRTNSSLATVAESAVERLVGLAMIVPDALISPVEEGGKLENDQDHGHPHEVYLDDSDLTTATVSVTGVAGAALGPADVAREQELALGANHERNASSDTLTNKESTFSSPSSPTSTQGAMTKDGEENSKDLVQSTPTDPEAEPSADGRPCDIDASKDMLTEGQAFAYVGLCLVTANNLFQALEGKETAHAKESLEAFVSKLINRLYRHLEIDTNTQRTIAQLPQMMIQPEDLLETFVADGTQRTISASQVDQTALSTSSSTSSISSTASASSSSPSRPSSPLPFHQHSRQFSSASLPSVLSRTTPPPLHSASSASLPRESTSSLKSDHSFSNVAVEKASMESSFRKNSSASLGTGIDSPSRALSRSPSPAPLPWSGHGSRNSISSQRAITVDLRWTLIADLFLISISDSVYDSRARVLLRTVGQHLGLEWEEIVQFEKSIMKQLQQQQAVTSDGLLKPDTKSRNDESRKRRMIMMGLATVGGGLVLGLSAGLFAPVIGAGIGAALAGAHVTGAAATAASAFLAGSGGIAVITSGAAVTGSGLAIKKMARRTAGINTFEFLAIYDKKRVNVILTISGWLDIGDEDASLPFSTLDPVNGDHYALFWEPEMLMQLGNALGLLATEVITLTAQEILKHTLLSALLSALAWPMALTRLGYLIDNPWSIALDRAKLAGLVLADSLLMRSYLGFRPVTLVGYSLGARVIFYCLLELGRLDAYGIVEDAYLFGAPITASEAQWRQARGAVAGNFVNGYLRNDWVLGFLFRATTGGLGTVAGLRPIKNVPGLNNMDLTSHVEGHLDYRLKIPLLMKLMGLKITSESFLEKEEAIIYQKSLKINPNETLKAPKPMMPSKAEIAASGSLTENEKLQLEAAFRRPAPRAKIPDLDSIKGLTPEEKEVLREALLSAAAAQGPASPVETYSRRK